MERGVMTRGGHRKKKGTIGDERGGRRETERENREEKSVRMKGKLQEKNICRKKRYEVGK
jgi:hypothetical protein